MDRGSAASGRAGLTETPPRSPRAGRGRWTLALPRGRRLSLGGPPLVMGVVNITPDSFSDGGLYLDPRRALERAARMERQGADLLDLGAESTRPGGGVYGDGASEIPIEEEIARLRPVLEPLRRSTDLPISVDTRRGPVAAYALAEGADLINDVGALRDPGVAEAVASTGCPVVLMHSRGKLRKMQKRIRFDDLLGDVRQELADALGRAERAGIDPRQVVLDPGIGFGKKRRHNLALLRRLDALSTLDRPLLVGASRKSFIGEITGEPPASRMPGSLAAAAWAAALGAAIVRVHDVTETVQFLRVWEAIERSHGGESR